MYCLVEGSDVFASEIRKNLKDFQNLKSFRYINSKNIDQGGPVREKAASAVELLQNEEKLRQGKRDYRRIRKEMGTPGILDLQEESKSRPRLSASLPRTSSSLSRNSSGVSRNSSIQSHRGSLASLNNGISTSNAVNALKEVMANKSPRTRSPQRPQPPLINTKVGSPAMVSNSPLSNAASSSPTVASGSYSPRSSTVLPSVLISPTRTIRASVDFPARHSADNSGGRQSLTLPPLQAIQEEFDGSGEVLARIVSEQGAV